MSQRKIWKAAPKLKNSCEVSSVGCKQFIVGKICGNGEVFSLEEQKNGE